MKALHLWKLVVGLTVASVFAGGGAAAGETEAEVGKPAPLFRLPVYNVASTGLTAVGLDRYVGTQPVEPAKVVLLSFMASFCKPCKKEMPYLQSLYTQYKDKGLRVIMVSMDGEPEGQKQIEALIAAHKITFPVLKDRFQVVGRRWLGMQTPLPSVFLIQANGTLASTHRGYDKDASLLLANEVEAALKAAGTSAVVTAE